MAVRIEKINADNPASRKLEKAAQLIARGKVIVCPTDTGYAFAANALNLEAVAKVFNLKGRSYTNPIHVAVDSLEAAGRYARLNKVAEHIARRFLPGALTLVLPRKEIVPSLLVAGRDTIGIRIPNNKAILALAGMTSLPLTATSANISGQPTPYSAEEVVEQMGKTIKDVALVLDQGALPIRGLSTIVDLTVDPPQLLRQGQVSWLELWQFLGSLHDSC